MILYTLDIKKLKEQGKNYIIVTLTCILFAIIYEGFSHGVISNFMMYAFTIPLLFGVFVYYLLYYLKIKKLPTGIENKTYNAGVATFTVGSIIEGVLQIYGTTNSKVYIYLVVGLVFLLFSISSYLLRKNKKTEEK